jgi:hypothetical protein
VNVSAIRIVTVTGIGHLLSTDYSIVYKTGTFDVMINLNGAHETYSLLSMLEFT